MIETRESRIIASLWILLVYGGIGIGLACAFFGVWKVSAIAFGVSAFAQLVMLHAAAGGQEAKAEE